jgi:hypothetical protein
MIQSGQIVRHLTIGGITLLLSACGSGAADEPTADTPTTQPLNVHEVILRTQSEMDEGIAIQVGAQVEALGNQLNDRDGALTITLAGARPTDEEVVYEPIDFAELVCESTNGLSCDLAGRGEVAQLLPPLHEGLEEVLDDDQSDPVGAFDSLGNDLLAVPSGQTAVGIMRSDFEQIDDTYNFRFDELTPDRIETILEDLDERGLIPHLDPSIHIILLDAGATASPNVTSGKVAEYQAFAEALCHRTTASCHRAEITVDLSILDEPAPERSNA